LAVEDAVEPRNVRVVVDGCGAGASNHYHECHPCYRGSLN
jgi:hypothetical protein